MHCGWTANCVSATIWGAAGYGFRILPTILLLLKGYVLIKHMIFTTTRLMKRILILLCGTLRVAQRIFDPDVLDDVIYWTEYVEK